MSIGRRSKHLIVLMSRVLTMLQLWESMVSRFYVQQKTTQRQQWNQSLLHIAPDLQCDILDKFCNKKIFHWKFTLD